MLDNDFLNKLSRQLSALLPMAGEVREELRTKIEQQLKKSLAGLDLLSRSEFEAQSQALERAQKRVQELEQTLHELDKRLSDLESKSANH